MKNMPTQRSGIFAELPDLLTELGYEFESIFKDTEIDPGTLTPETRIPFDLLLKFLHHASKESNCPHLGLLLGLRFEFSIHGKIGRLMQTAPNVQQALLDFVTWQPGYSSGATVYINRIGNEFAFGYGSFTTALPGSVVLNDAVIGVGIKMLSQMTKGVAKPIEVHFSHRGRENKMDYAKLLKLPVHFDMHQTCLILDANTMQTPLIYADKTKHQLVLDEIRHDVFKRPMKTSELTRHALRQLLHTGNLTISEVAAKLAMHPRTLRRRLTGEGHSFRDLRDQVRFSVARELLDLTEIPVGEIAAAVAFASAGVFTDAFRRYNGESPSVRRARFAENGLTY